MCRESETAAFGVGESYHLLQQVVLAEFRLFTLNKWMQFSHNAKEKILMSNQSFHAGCVLDLHSWDCLNTVSRDINRSVCTCCLQPETCVCIHLCLCVSKSVSLCLWSEWIDFVSLNALLLGGGGCFSCFILADRPFRAKCILNTVSLYHQQIRHSQQGLSV